MKLLLALFLSTLAFAQADHGPKTSNRPVEPFRIVSNIYYVGANEVTSFLIVTPKGDVLLDGGFPESAPLIRDNIRKLGFKLADVKYLLNSQAHSDHAGGLAELKRLTGAQLVTSHADGELIARGGHNDFAWGDTMTFPPVESDRFIDDGGTVELGGSVMTAHITPGHTKGCTTWTTQVEEAGKRHDVVFVCSTTVPGYKLVNNPNYPNIVQDYRATFATLRNLPCDVMLGSHGSFFGLDAKRAALKKNPKVNPFIDPHELRAFLDDSEAAFNGELKKQSK